MPHVQTPHYQYLWGALAGGFAGMAALTFATVDTQSTAVEVLFIALSSLLVPSLYVYYLDLRNRFIEPRRGTLIGTFLLGAFLGVPLAVILEKTFGTGVGAPGPAFGSGLVEEFSKATAVFWLLRRKHADLEFEMDGIIVGAAAGMGFAALEDMVYGAAAFHYGLTAVVATVWLRQLLAPFGHGTWTAIVAGTIWREKRGGRVQITQRVVGAYLLAAGLHGLWDWAPVGLWTILLVGVAGIYILRGMIKEALQQEQGFIARWMSSGTPASRQGGRGSH
jgi:RsiW-degrading membrane proteinase PrsW (M82 family)